MHICLDLDDVIIPCESTNRVDLWLKFFLDSSLQYEPLEQWFLTGGRQEISRVARTLTCSKT